MIIATATTIKVKT
ncbi:rCG57416 [Rattus norvegicus]|uniref:RCG57416 n=1 Tax=Rattus norvegicus TaxID=10116 RepID=A6JP63_RAT|nr:rCG57416 [Rattus norvegicus]